MLRAAWPPALAVALPLLAQAALSLCFARVYGDPLAAAHAERDFYVRWLDWPWFGPIQGIRLILRHADPYVTLRAVFELGTTLAGLACAVLLTRRRPAFSPALVWYGWAALLFAL